MARALVPPRMQPHFQAMAWAQRNKRFHFDWMDGSQNQSVALRDCGGDQFDLHHGEVVSDTQARSAAEGKIGKGMAAPASLR